jgi:signal transduction histidine kinase
VKHMVDTMRGKVSVESAVGAGSTFTISLQRVNVTPFESGKHPLA